MPSLFPAYTHIIKPKLKYIYLSFNHTGDLIIKSPKVSQREIEKILIKKATWINKSRQKLFEKKGKPITFEEGEELFYLGKSYPVHYRQSDQKQVSLQFDEEDGFSLAYNKFDIYIFEEFVNQFYKNEAKRLIPEIVDKYAEEMKLFPSRISFRKARSRWGSCSNTNAISFNYLMMKLPLSVIAYIIIHELAHIQHKHHQKEFWNCVKLYLPDYQEQKNELKRYM
ncbi:MAG: M48 family peptidase [Epsilonproteobacteria bacterium]|nr:MAG: M48 family peptidase [Campylobacterota bacterium]